MKGVFYEKVMLRWGGGEMQDKTAGVVPQWTRHRVFTLGDARSFSALTSKITPLGSMFNFDADVKKTTACH